MSVNNWLMGTLFLACSSLAFSQDKHQVIEGSEIRYGLGMGGALFDTFVGENKPYRGRSLYVSRRKNFATERITLRESHHGLQVLTHLQERAVERNWAIEYSPFYFLNAKKETGLYAAPLLGVKIKEKLKVKCRDKDRVCFNSYMDRWKITGKDQSLRPMLGLSSGINIKMHHVVINWNAFVNTDFENNYYGMEFSIGGSQ